MYNLRSALLGLNGEQKCQRDAMILGGWIGIKCVVRSGCQKANPTSAPPGEFRGRQPHYQ